MTYPAITITDSTPFDFRWSDIARKENMTGVLEVFVNSSTADVYYGDVPESPVIMAGYASVIAGGNKIPFDRSLQGEGASRRSWDDIMPGFVFSCADEPADDGNFVVAKEKEYVLMRNAMTITPSDDTIVFTPPAITSANGQPIFQGTGKSFVADRANRFLEVAKRFVVAAGQTAVIRVEYKLL